MADRSPGAGDTIGVHIVSKVTGDGYRTNERERFNLKEFTRVGATAGETVTAVARYWLLARRIATTPGAIVHEPLKTMS